MDDTIEKEFIIGEIMNLYISRNDFDELGSVLQIKITNLIQNNHIIVMSFYTQNGIQIKQKELLMLCDHENILFDNVLLISALQNNCENVYKIKFLNKEIFYMKLYISSSYKTKGNKSFCKYDFTQIFDLKEVKILNKEEVNNLMLSPLDNSINETEKNDNLNLIISELDKVNKSLIAEKEKLDIKKKQIEEQENHINKVIIDFKNEMHFLGEKYYGECLNEVNEKVNFINKKINICENNVMNKYKIIKDKLKYDIISQNKNNINNSNTGLSKDKFANLEIKIKFLEDSNNALKKSILEKDEKIKELTLLDEKHNKKLKQLKDDNVILQSQIKEYKSNNNKEINLQSSKISNQSNYCNLQASKMSAQSNTSTKYKNKSNNNTIYAFELNKTQISGLTSIYINTTLLNQNINSINDSILISILLMNVSINPIILFNKFEYGHILLFNKLSYIYLNNDTNQLSSICTHLNELIQKFNEFKSNIYSYLKTTKNNNDNNNTSLINLNINIDISQKINLSEMIYSKGLNFDSFLLKNINKTATNFLSTPSNINLISKYILVSNSIILALVSDNISNATTNILNIHNRFILTKDDEILNFLSKNKYLKLLFNIFIDHSLKTKNKSLSIELYNILIDTFLIFHCFDLISESININFLNDILSNKSKSELLLDIIKSKIKVKSIDDISIDFKKNILFLTNTILLFPDLQQIIQNNLKEELSLIKSTLYTQSNNNPYEKKINKDKTLYTNLNILTNNNTN